MDAIPIYQPLGGSNLSLCLKSFGFSSCHVISISSPNAFYKILAQGLIVHFESSYPCSSHLQKWWQGKARLLWREYEKYGGYGPAKFSDCSYWNDIGAALIGDIKNGFSPDKPFIPKVTAGLELDKGLSAQYNSITGHFSMALLWYEAISHSQNILNTYITANQNNPQVYVCIAQEGNSYYLLYSDLFNPSAPVEGFPYYTLSPTDRKIPLIDASQRPIVDNTQEITSECINTLTTLAEKLVSLLLKVRPQPIPPEFAPDQMAIKELRDKARVLIERCSCSSHAITSQEFEAISTVAQAPTLVMRPNFHDARNCESFPELQLDESHNGEFFHKVCLERYIRSLPLATVYNCPRCRTPLSEILLQRVVPDIMERMQIGKDTTFKMSQTMDYLWQGSSNFPSVGQASAQFAPLAYPSQEQYVPQQSLCSCCQRPINKGRGAVMDCGGKVCADCCFQFQGVCKCCGNLLSSQERDILAKLYSLTIV